MQQNLFILTAKYDSPEDIRREGVFFPPFFHLVTYKQELDSYENVLYKLEMLKATY